MHMGTHTHWMTSSPTAETLNRQISNIPEVMGALQLYSPANSWAKSIKVTVLLLPDPGSTLGTWQLHSSSVSAVSGLIAVRLQYQLSANGGTDTWVQVSVAPPPSRSTSGMLGPTAGWMVNSVVLMDMWRQRKGGRGGGRDTVSKYRYQYFYWILSINSTV